MKTYFLIGIALCTIFAACKKDDQGLGTEKVYLDEGYERALLYYDARLQLTLQPKFHAIARVSGGLSYEGTYKQTGDKIAIKTKGGTLSYQVNLIKKSLS